MENSKQQRERDFHNAAFSDFRRKAVVPAYSVMHESKAFFQDYVRQHATGARLLEYGCGATAVGSTLGARADELVGIDISDVAVEQASTRAGESGLNAKYFVMDAEHLAFPDQSFDLVCSVAILHHLDLDNAYSEIARVLRPSGSAIFLEPLGHNPVINLYRRLTPTLRTPDEHPLLLRDLELARRYFDRVEVRYYVLASLLAMLVRNATIFMPVLRTLESLDRWIFKLAPWVRRQAWQVVIVLARPKPLRAAPAAPRHVPLV